MAISNPMILLLFWVISSCRVTLFEKCMDTLKLESTIDKLSYQTEPHYHRFFYTHFCTRIFETTSHALCPQLYIGWCVHSSVSPALHHILRPLLRPQLNITCSVHSSVSPAPHHIKRPQLCVHSSSSHAVSTAQHQMQCLHICRN